MASTVNVPILPVLVPARTYCACTIAQCVLCSYPLYSIWAWPARAMYLSCPCLCLHIRTVLVPLHNVYRACTTCTVFWRGQHGRCTYLARACACTYVLCLYHCTMCTVLVPLVQCFGMASTGNVPILLVFVLGRTYCACTIAQCFDMGNPGNLPILPACVSYFAR